MAAKLQKYFPMIKSREEVLAEIEANHTLRRCFRSWTEEQQKEFLDFVTGVRGTKILYDSFFKEIFNPETVPERLSEFFSILLGEKVKVLCALPNDSTRIADESSLLITDIVAQLEDGRIVNIEIQKIGYHFPGQRCACYSSDLLLRQYKRVRGELAEKNKMENRNEKFTYKSIKPVYTIVLFEHSPEAFKEYPEQYLHYFEQKSDTGLEMELLQKYIFVSLDIFKRIVDNRGIENKLEAWLGFLSIQDAEFVEKLLSAYPEFKKLYERVYDICENVERVAKMFSKELQELDRNTVQYMIDEMQATIEKQKAELEDQKKILENQNKVISQQKIVLEEQNEVINQQKQALDEQRKSHEEILKRIALLEKN